MTASAVATPSWRLAALLPLAAPVVDGLVEGLPIEVVGDLDDADIAIYDFRPLGGLDADALAGAPRLVFVQQPGVGVQAHDLDAMAAAGVALSNVAGFNAVAVAEWVLGAMFAVARQFRWVEDELRAGRWTQLSVIERGAIEIAGRSVGLVGFGSIAQVLVPRLTALGCGVSYWSRSQRPPELSGGARYRELDDLVATSDVLVNLVPLAPATRNLLSAQRLALLPAGAMVVNASRGGIVDEDAVVEAVQAGRLMGAAFDVYATEPLPLDSPLRSCDRILLTAHTAGSTRETVQRLIEGIRANLVRVTSGEPVIDVVNGVDPLIRRR